MTRERRQTERHRVSGPAKIRPHAGALARDCWVSDISEGGVRLYAEHVEVPEEFILVCSAAGNRPRECRVVWRLGCEVGAEFVDRRDMGLPRRVAAR
jgi:hypothetical protein